MAAVIHPLNLDVLSGVAGEESQYEISCLVLLRLECLLFVLDCPLYPASRTRKVCGDCEVVILAFITEDERFSCKFWGIVIVEGVRDDHMDGLGSSRDTRRLLYIRRR